MLRRSLRTPAHVRNAPPPPPAVADSAPKPVVLDWPVGARSSAELLALQLTLRLQHDLPLRVVPSMQCLMPGTMPLSADEQATIVGAFASSASECARLLAATGPMLPALGLRWLGDGLHGMPEPLSLPLRHNVGIVSTLAPVFDVFAQERARACDLLLAGSTWMRDALSASGIAHTAVLPSGIDTSLFTPGVKSGHLSQRFVIFSAGRLHLHKGQDLVVAAVKRFWERHPETLLLTAWQTPWPETIGDMSRGGHASGPLEYHGESLNVVKWAAANGLADGTVVDLGMLSQPQLAVVMREADVALFPNRAESDLNPLVLECMACGVPTIVSRNTGHSDLAQDALCFPLAHQRPVRGLGAAAETQGWGESSVDEIIAHLELVHAQSHSARARAAAALEWVQAFAWRDALPRWITTLAPFFGHSER